MSWEPAYKERDVVVVEIIHRDWSGFVRDMTKEIDVVFKVGKSGVHLVNTGYLQYDKPFPQWSIRKATTDELLLYKLENPDAYV